MISRQKLSKSAPLDESLLTYLLIPSVPFHWVSSITTYFVFLNTTILPLVIQTQDLRTFLNFFSPSLNFLEVMSFHLFFFFPILLSSGSHNVISPSLQSLSNQVLFPLFLQSVLRPPDSLSSHFYILYSENVNSF